MDEIEKGHDFVKSIGEGEGQTPWHKLSNEKKQEYLKGKDRRLSDLLKQVNGFQGKKVIKEDHDKRLEKIVGGDVRVEKFHKSTKVNRKVGDDPEKVVHYKY